MRALLGLCLVFLAGNTSCKNCPEYGYQSQFNYSIKTAFTTPSGIAVDPTGQAVSAELIDRLTDEVETCLAVAFGATPVIPVDAAVAGQCLNRTFDLPFRRNCLTIKVPDDWELSCDGEEQLLPLSRTTYRPPDELCRAKGLEPTPNCPCRWRAGIQDNHTIVTTPNFYLYKDPLIRMFTGCNNLWAVPALAQCATPSKP